MERLAEEMLTATLDFANTSQTSGFAEYERSGPGLVSVLDKSADRDALKAVFNAGSGDEMELRNGSTLHNAVARLVGPPPSLPTKNEI